MRAGLFRVVPIVLVYSDWVPIVLDCWDWFPWCWTVGTGFPPCWTVRSGSHRWTVLSGSFCAGLSGLFGPCPIALGYLDCFASCRAAWARGRCITQFHIFRFSKLAKLCNSFYFLLADSPVLRGLRADFALCGENSLQAVSKPLITSRFKIPDLSLLGEPAV